MNDEDGKRAAQSEVERRLATLLSNLPGMVYRCRNDREWTMEFVSDGCESLTGYKAAELVGAGARAFNSLIHPEDREGVWSEVQAAVKQGLPFRITYRIRAANGQEKWVWEQGVGVYAGTELEALEGFITDIANRKIAEQERRHIEEQYRLISENTADVIWLWDVLDRRRVYVSPSVRQIGFSPAEVMTQPLEQSMPRETFLKVMADFQARRAALEAGDESARVSTTEIDFLRKDGTPVATESVTQFLSDEQHGIRYVLGVSRDITERKRAEVSLRDSERILRVSQKVAGLGSYVLDVHSGTWTSSAVLDEILGIDETFVRSVEGWLSLVHPDWREQMADHFTNRVLGERKRFDKEYMVTRHSDGQARWVHGQGELEFDARGEPVRMVGTILDISQRKAAEAEKAALEAQLRQAQKMESIGRLAGGVAHDFNNLLTVISGYSGFLLKGLNDGDRMRSYAEQIHVAGERAAGLTRQLLAFSRKQVIEPKVFDFNLMIRQATPLLQRMIGEDIVLETSLESSGGQVLADQSQIHQVILNLAVNARDAMPDGGTLLIETSTVGVGEATAIRPDLKPGRYVRMTVTDNGHGMDPATCQRIFEPFFTTKEVGKGTGLGLATAYGIVRQSGGWIDVRSEVGVGTSFDVFLPRVEDGETSEGEGPGAHVQKGSETVLVVEDEAAVRSFTAASLELFGYHVLQASAGPQAIDFVQWHPGQIQLLITDVVMPGMNGRELSERLKTLRPRLKLLFMSGHAADAFADSGVLARGAAFLQKPFSPEELVAKVREVLDRPGEA